MSQDSTTVSLHSISNTTYVIGQSDQQNKQPVPITGEVVNIGTVNLQLVNANTLVTLSPSNPLSNLDNNTIQRYIDALKKALYEYYEKKYGQLNPLLTTVPFKEGYITPNVVNARNQPFDVGTLLKGSISVIALCGPAGVGKSTCISSIFHSFRGSKPTQNNKFFLIFNSGVLNASTQNTQKPCQISDLVALDCPPSLSQEGRNGLELLPQYYNRNAGDFIISIDNIDHLNPNSVYTLFIESLFIERKSTIIAAGRTKQYSDFKFDEIYTIKPFNQNQAYEFIEKYFRDNPNTITAVKSYLRKLPASQYGQPLVLAMLCHGWKLLSKNDLSESLTVTNFFRKTIFQTINHYLKRPTIQQYFNYQGIHLESYAQEPENRMEELCGGILQATAKIAFIAKAKGSIDESLLNSVINRMYGKKVIEAKMGLMTHLIEMGFIQALLNDHAIVNAYDFTHETIMDYFAAYHWCYLFTHSNKQMKRKSDSVPNNTQISP